MRRPLASPLILLGLLVLALLLVTQFSGPTEAAPQPPADEEDTFVPSEELPADSSISFPVDI